MQAEQNRSVWTEGEVVKGIQIFTEYKAAIHGTARALLNQLNCLWTKLDQMETELRRNNY
jgi:hypothetical protein